MRGATFGFFLLLRQTKISTHAPLAGRDVFENLELREITDISTHAPLAGRDNFTVKANEMQEIFQPTRPLRGATFEPLGRAGLRKISTHAPLAGRDIDIKK